MLGLVAKALLSGALIAAISEIGKRLPAMLRAGMSFWLLLVAGCVPTVALYALLMALAPRLGQRL
ncbi:MAG TPA: hypothetical protein VL094_13580 [Sphingomonadaceae bacterium]|nr:hypothetical protein [Sphingomonadaceae bacterium]